MRLPTLPPDDFLHERALATTTLTPDQDDFAPRRLDPGQQTSQQTQLNIPLQKHELKATEAPDSRRRATG